MSSSTQRLQEQDTERMEESFSSEGDVMGPSDTEIDGDQILLTLKEIFARIEQAWMNEKLAPELLPPLEEEKDAIMGQVKIMERNLGNLDKQDMRTEIHRLELERIKFVVVSYMRTRLFKIQEMAWFLLEAENKRSRNKATVLMPEELKFLRSYTSRTEEYMTTSVTSNFPQPLQKYDAKKYQNYPHMDAYVFFRATEDNTIEVEDANEETHLVNVRAGEQHVMRYQPLSKLVFSGSINLV